MPGCKLLWKEAAQAKSSPRGSKMRLMPIFCQWIPFSLEATGSIQFTQNWQKSKSSKACMRLSSTFKTCFHFIWLMRASITLIKVTPMARPGGIPFVVQVVPIFEQRFLYHEDLVYTKAIHIQTAFFWEIFFHLGMLDLKMQSRRVILKFNSSHKGKKKLPNFIPHWDEVLRGWI